MNKYIVKISSMVHNSDEPKDSPMSKGIGYGVSASIGGSAGILGDIAVTRKLPKKNQLGKIFAVGAGLQLIGDAAAVKINNAIQKKMLSSNHKQDTQK